MGQLYTKLNQLVMNDIDAAADPERRREKLETAFTTPARPLAVRLADPRSATLHIDRTPIFATVSNRGPTDTPKAKSTLRPRYLETDLDDDLPLSMAATSTPVQRKFTSPGSGDYLSADSVVEEVTNSAQHNSPDGIIGRITSEEQAVEIPSSSEQPPPMNVSEVQATEDSKAPLGDWSYAEEPAISPEIEISCVDDVVEVVMDPSSDSFVANWSGVLWQDKSVGPEAELSTQLTDYPTFDDTADDRFNQSVSLLVHDGSRESLATESPVVPAKGVYVDPTSTREPLNNAKNLGTPQKLGLSNKLNGIRTPLGDVSTNSPVISTIEPLNQTPTDGKQWKTIRDERLKRGLADAENSPIRSAYQLEVVQSAPGKIRSKSNRTGTRWTNDSLLI